MLVGVSRPILLLLAFTATAAGDPRSGKVVRVERRLQKSGPIRVCEVKPNGSGMCFGDAPASGDLIEVVDEQQVFAEVRIGEVNAQSASCDSMWNIKGEVLRGDLTNSQWGRSIGVVDTRLDRRSARKIAEDHLPPPPSGRTDERVIGAIDRTGAGSIDIVLTQYGCDGNGTPNPQGNEQCFELWSRDQPAGWHRVRQMLLTPCFR
jgi:hypothetical protein